MLAYLVDEGLATRLAIEDMRARKNAKLPDGQVFATESDYGDPLPAEPPVPGPAAGVT